MTTVAEKNKNPLNLRPLPNDTWNGQIGVDTNDETGSFCVFQDNIYGVRAAVRNMRSLIRVYAAITIRQMLYHWAPPNDPFKPNETDAYIARVCAYCWPKEVKLLPYAPRGTEQGDKFFADCQRIANSKHAQFGLGWITTEGYGDDDMPMLVKIIRAMNIVEAGAATIDDVTALKGIRLALGLVI